MFPHHHALHRYLHEFERELLQKRAKWEAEIDAAAAAPTSTRREQTVAGARQRPIRRIDPMRPVHWLMHRLSQELGSS